MTRPPVIRRRGEIITLSAPYSDRVRMGMRAIVGARWDAINGMWSVPDTERDELRDLVETIYGPQHVPSWLKRGADQ